MMLEFISSLVPLQSKKLFLSFAFAQRSQGASALPTTELVANTKPAVVMIETGDKPYQPHLAGHRLFHHSSLDRYQQPHASRRSKRRIPNQLPRPGQPRLGLRKTVKKVLTIEEKIDEVLKRVKGRGCGWIWFWIAVLVFLAPKTTVTETQFKEMQALTSQLSELQSQLSDQGHRLQQIQQELQQMRRY
jgi:hypothetical protein